MAEDKTGLLLSRARCQALKGVAIVMIMIHNMAHWLPGAAGENEYSFSHTGTMYFLDKLFHPEHTWLLQIFSFLGHYGVPLFVFLSAYGLVKKYELSHREAAAIPAGRFIWNHYKKLLILILIGMATLYLCQCVMPLFRADSDLMPSMKTAREINYILPDEWWPLQATMVINFSPWPFPWSMKRFLLGPYWFFSFIMQLYVIYRLLLFTRDHNSRRAWLAPVIFALVAWAAMQVTMSIGATYALFIMRYNFFMGCLPFAMGLLAARYEHRLPQLNRWQWLAIFILSSVLVVAFNCNGILWLWAPALVVTAGIGLMRVTPKWLIDLLKWVGSISMMIFIIHPIVRMEFYNIDGTIHPYRLMAIYVVISFILAIIYQAIYNRVMKRMRN